MKSFLFFFLLILLFIRPCYSQDLQSATNGRLFDAIESFLKEPKVEGGNLPIINVEFKRECNTCHLHISDGLRYFRIGLLGVVMHEGKLIAFYGDRSLCYLSFINESELLQDIPDGFYHWDQHDDLRPPPPPHNISTIRYTVSYTTVGDQTEAYLNFWCKDF
jgi:hypothetical protein